MDRVAFWVREIGLRMNSLEKPKVRKVTTCRRVYRSKVVEQETPYTVMRTSVRVPSPTTEPVPNDVTVNSSRTKTTHFNSKRRVQRVRLSSSTSVSTSQVKVVSQPEECLEVKGSVNMVNQKDSSHGTFRGLSPLAIVGFP